MINNVISIECDFNQEYDVFTGKPTLLWESTPQFIVVTHLSEATNEYEPSILYEFDKWFESQVTNRPATKQIQTGDITRFGKSCHEYFMAIGKQGGHELDVSPLPECDLLCVDVHIDLNAGDLPKVRLTLIPDNGPYIAFQRR